jgi:gliding motility-associated-like protein
MVQLICIAFNPAIGQIPVAKFTGAPLQGCPPLVVNFTDQSTGSPTSWNWNFGNGNSSTLRNPTATYFTPGTYTVSLTVTNASGSNTITKTQYVTVFDPPTVNFSGTPRAGCYPLKVQFTDLSTAGNGNSVSSWFWDFGDGQTSTLRNPLITYGSSGNFSVTLKIINDKGCSKTFTRPNYIAVSPGVKALFTNSVPSVCHAPATVTFTNNSTGPGTLSYQWDFGDAGTSNATNPVHSFTTNGTFTVVLIVTSSSGCQDTMRLPVTIGNFNTSFTVAPQVCINSLVSFQNTSTPAPQAVLWKFGDGGTATTLNATHRYTANGTYTVWLYNSYSTCVDSVSQTVTVVGPPIPDFSAPIRSKCQPPLDVSFQDLSSAGATSWQWDFGDGGSSNQQNPNHTYNAYGSFTVKLIVTNSTGCRDSIIKTDYVIVRRAQITIPLFPARGCVPFTINPIPIINAVDNVLTYEWDFGDGGTSTLQNPSHTYNIQGTYDVKLIITTSTGCRDTLLVPQAVKAGTHPTVDFTAVPIPVCGNQPVQFTDLSAPADEWIWDFGDGGSATSKNPSHRYQDTGYFNVKLVAINSGCKDSLIKSAYIYVLPPVARYNYTADCSNHLLFSFRDSSIAPLSWDWDFGDGGTASTPNPVHSFPALGTYSVRLIVSNGGCIDTLIKTIHVIDEHADFSAAGTVACHPATISLTATNINAANIANYYWDFGDATNSNTSLTTINHVYYVAGSYTVTLTITDLNGCTNTVTKINYIQINGPEADFSAPAHSCLGAPTVFTDISVTDGTHAITNWKFDFGDGVIQNFSAPPFQHTYNVVDTFTIKLEITDASGCIDSVTYVDYVSTTDPVPVFSVSNVLSCPNSNIAFNSDSYPNIVSTNWDFGDGNTASATSVLHAYANPGVYTVRLDIADQFGCTDSLIRTAYIHVDKPLAQYVASDTASSCPPFEVHFTNNSTYYNGSFWDFGPGEGTTMVDNPVHYFSSPGNYPVKLIVTSPGGCKDSVIHFIHVYDTAGSRIDYLPLSGCKPLLVNLNSFTNGVIDSFLWDFGDGVTITTASASISHVYASFGDFLPKLIMTDPTGCQIPVRGALQVHATGAEANFGADDSLFCDRATVQFTDSTAFNEPVSTYTWNFGDGNGSSQQNPVHDYNTPGLYTVQLIVRTASNCLDTFSKVKYIAVVQRPLIDIGGDSVVCVHSSLNEAGIFVQPDTSVVQWQWTFPNGNSYSGQSPPAQVYNTPGTFQVTTIATNSSGCRDTSSQTIYVMSLPTATIPGQMTVQNGFPVQLPATYSPNTVSWQWLPPSGLSCDNCPAPLVGPKFNTTYVVRFTDDIGCSNSASVEVVVICKNMNLFIPNTFSPNNDGSNDVFYPRGRGLERVKQLRIFNRWGEVVFEKKDFPVNDPSVGWDGRYKGQRPAPGVYVYQAEVFCENGEIITLNGNVALIL